MKGLPEEFLDIFPHVLAFLREPAQSFFAIAVPGASQVIPNLFIDFLLGGDIRFHLI